MERHSISSISSFILFIFSLILHTPPGAATKAHQYTARHFERIRRTAYPHFVMFYAPWCTHCSAIADVWDEFASQNHDKGRMKVAKVDCTTDTKICAAENIKAYPTFLLYTTQNKHVYRGTRHGSYFMKFVRSIVPDLKDHQVPHADADSIHSDTSQHVEDNTPLLPTVLTKDTFAVEIDKDFTFVDFFAPWCSHCIKFEPTWNKLADTLKYNKKVTIAKVDCTADPELCKAAGITGYPTLKLYKDGVVEAQYQQDRRLETLVAFIQFHLSKGDDPSHQENDAHDMESNPDTHDDDDNEWRAENDVGNEFDSSQNDANKNLLTRLTDETFHQVLSERPHLAYFHNDGARVSRMDVAVMKQVAQRLRFLRHDVAVAVVDCTVLLEVCNHFSMHHFSMQQEASLRAEVMYLSSNMESSMYEGLLDVNNLVQFVLQETKYHSDRYKGSDKDEL